MTTQAVTAMVSINGANQSSQLTDTVEIEIEENVARVAKFTLLPGAGLTDLIGWVGADVVIQSVVNGNTVTEFTGVIDSPQYNAKTGLTVFTCTDNLQEFFETKSNAEIDALVPGYWSEASFNDSDGWDYAQERLSTIPSSLDMDALRQVRVTDWEAGASNYTFTESGIVDGSLQTEAIARRRDIVNAIDIVMDYRYVRLKQREQDYDWFDSGVVCDFYYNPYPIPSKGRILESIDNTGWELTLDPIWTLQQPSGSYLCGLTDVIHVQNPNFVQGVQFSIGTRYSQNITERYTVRVESADSIDSLGEIAIAQTAALSTDYDLKEWDESLIADGWTDFGTYAVDVNDDKYVNKDDTTERQNALDTVVNLAKTKILGSHRKTEISAVVPYHQGVDVIHTVGFSTSKLSASGKVSKVVKTINTQTSEALTKITIRLSKPFGVGVPGEESTPSVPDGLPVVPDTQTVDLNLLSHLGGQDDTEFDENWSGWIADYISITEPGHVPYPKEFVVHTPAIQLNSVANIEPIDVSLINVTVPDDNLS